MPLFTYPCACMHPVVLTYHIPPLYWVTFCTWEIKLIQEKRQKEKTDHSQNLFIFYWEMNIKVSNNLMSCYGVFFVLGGRPLSLSLHKSVFIFLLIDVFSETMIKNIGHASPSSHKEASTSVCLRASLCAFISWWSYACSYVSEFA